VSDPDAGLAWLDATIRGVPAAAGSGWADDTNPYPGLRPFDLGWRRVFFGRDHDRQVVASTLRSPATDGLVVVVGPSGCGKSSLVRAGVLPFMASHDEWGVLPAILPGAGPVEALAVEVAAQGVGLGLVWTLAQVHLIGGLSNPDHEARRLLSGADDRRSLSGQYKSSQLWCE
jgi:Novel STAND NTPase 1